MVDDKLEEQSSEGIGNELAIGRWAYCRAGFRVQELERCLNDFHTLREVATYLPEQVYRILNSIFRDVIDVS